MNMTRLIWGMICLVLAGVLLVLDLTLPPDSMVFYVGEANMRWVPTVVLAIVGIALLATARSSGPATLEAQEPLVAADSEKIDLNKRLESIGWGFFLLMLGGFALVPAETIPKGLWSIGLGLIMLGLNAARYYYKIRMSGFTTFLGLLAVLGGLSELLGFTALEGGLLLIILGAYLLLKPWFEKQKLFGKAEQS